MKSASRCSITTSPPTSRPAPRRARSVSRVGRSRSSFVPDGRDPFPQPVAGLSEVAVPRQAAPRAALRVVGVEPVGVQRGEFPDQFVVAVPVRRDHRRRQPVGQPQPVHPRVEVEPLGLGLVGGQQVPVDRAQRLVIRIGSPGRIGAAARVIATDDVVVRLQERRLGLFGVGGHRRPRSECRRPGPAPWPPCRSLLGGSGCCDGVRSTSYLVRAHVVPDAGGRRTPRGPRSGRCGPISYSLM